MIYHKFQLTDEVEIKAEFHEDQLFTYCTECGNEIYLSADEIVQVWDHGGDSASTSFLCANCTDQN